MRKLILAVAAAIGFNAAYSANTRVITDEPVENETITVGDGDTLGFTYAPQGAMILVR